MHRRETDMDGSFTIKPNAAVPKFTPRDRSPARPVETELDAAKTVTAAGDGGNEQRERRPITRRTTSWSIRRAAR